MIPERVPEHIVMVLYDLRDRKAQEDAHADKRAWGQECTNVYVIDRDHVILAFLPGGAAEEVRRA